jgi:two-component system, OmpR family, response regulator
MSQTVLIVDDDPLLQRLLEGLLHTGGYRVQCASNIQQALRSVQRHPPDAAIVDVDLGESESGLNLLGIWRTRYHFPVMVLSSRSQPSDRIIGLELGALDYVVKPFDPRELLLRLKLILQRSPVVPSVEMPLVSWQLGEMTFDTTHRHLVQGADKTPLSPFESDLLMFLTTRANSPVTREQILDAVQSRDRQVNDRAVDVLVGRLRKKLANSQVSIQSVRSIGYMLSGPVRQH